MDWAYLKSASHALQSFAVEYSSIEFISQSENFSYRVGSTDGESFVLRLHRPSYHNLTELESEQAWTEALLNSGIDVPVALKTSGGHRYAQVETPDGPRFAGMLEWVDGEVLADTSTIAQLQRSGQDPLRLLGRIIAGLHEHAMNWEIPEGFERHSLDVEGFVGKMPFWGRFWECSELDDSHRSNLRSMRKTIKKILMEYSENCGAYSLIHADLHAYNVIVHGSRLHIIDFDDSAFGWHSYDLAVALHNLRDTPQYPAAKSSLLDGYTDIRPIASKEIDMIEFFLVVRSLASIGWVSARPELNRDRRSICLSLHDDAMRRLSEFECLS